MLDVRCTPSRDGGADGCGVALETTGAFVCAAARSEAIATIDTIARAMTPRAGNLFIDRCPMLTGAVTQIAP